MSISGVIKTLFSDHKKTQAIFPRTKVSAVSDDNGVGLDALLAEKASESFVTTKIAEAQLSGEGTEIDLSGYATKDDVRNIDFPVDSVNSKTGAVVLSASDVGAAPASHTTDKNNPHGVTAEQAGAMANTSAKWLPQNGMSIRDFPSGITMYSVNPNNMIAEGVPTGFSEYATVTGFKLGEYDYYEYTDVFGHKAIWNTNANNEWVRVYSTATKPTAVEIGAQPALGFTPVQQGLNASGGNRIQLAWGNDGSGKYALMCYIDGTYTGKVVTDNASFGGIAPIANGGTGATTAAQALINLGAAPDGYGLGKTQGFTISSGGDCNYARENGWYYVKGALNAAHEYDHSMLVASYGTGSIQQIAFMGSAFSANTNIAVRKCSNGNWSAWEWINAPMSPGVEYRTTERWYNGSPVYTQIVNLGTTTADCSFNINISGLIALVRAVPSLHNTYCTDWDIDAGVHATNQFYFCPAKSSTGVVIYARCGSNYTGKTLIVQIWYTK